MKTIGRHIRQPHVPGDFEAVCDICGATWLRSDLRKDGTGQLRCPDDQGERDRVTIAKANASIAARAGSRSWRIKEGRKRDSNRDYLTTPKGILVEPVAHWTYQQGVYLSAGNAFWPNALPSHKWADSFGDASGVRTDTSPNGADIDPDVALPAWDSGYPHFDHQSLNTPRGQFAAAGSLPAAWVVASLDTYASDDHSATTTGLFSLTNSSPPSVAVGFTWLLSSVVHFALQVTNRDTTPMLTGYAIFTTAGAMTVSVTYPDDAGLHLIGLRLEGDGLVLELDGVETKTAITDGDSLLGAVDHASIGGAATFSEGGSHNTWDGVIREVVVGIEPSASEIADMRTYFARNHSELSL